MNFVKHIERIELVDKLIKERSTGTPDELAKKLSLSRRQLYRVIEELKDYGAPIAYCRSKQTFYYLKDDFEIRVNFSLQFISESEGKNIIGGHLYSKISSCFFLTLYENNLAFTI